MNLFKYKNILIDTDLEPDDKGALEAFFRELYFHAQANPKYVYPTITIVAGSSKTPAIKEAQAKKIIANLKAKGFIPAKAAIRIIKGSATHKSHPDDGKELLKPTQLNVKPEDPNRFSRHAVRTIKHFLRHSKHQKSLYLSLREVKDLKEACSQSRKKKFNVDFMGTLSFNVTRVYENEPGGANGFINEILPRFNQVLCYENFHSALNNNSTGPIWSESFKNYLRSDAGKLLRQAAYWWDKGNIEDCIRTISDPTYERNKVNLLQISEEQAKAAYDFQMQVWEDAKTGNLRISEAEFRTTLYAIFGGTEFEKQVNDTNTDISQAFNPNVNPFCNMIFNAPQLCLADLAFLSLVCQPEMLQQATKRTDVVYNDRFSKITDNVNSNIQFVVMNEAQLRVLGTKVVDTLTRSPIVETKASDEKTRTFGRFITNRYKKIANHGFTPSFLKFNHHYLHRVR